MLNSRIEKALYGNILLLIFIFSFAGCRSANVPTYSSEQYAFEYPNTYFVEESGEEQGVLIVNGEKGRVEIFKTADLADSTGGERIHGYSGSGLDEFEWKLVPKEKLKSGSYEIWLFYEENDEQTKKEVQAVYNSLKIK